MRSLAAAEGHREKNSNVATIWTFNRACLTPAGSWLPPVPNLRPKLENYAAQNELFRRFLSIALYGRAEIYRACI